MFWFALSLILSHHTVLLGRDDISLNDLGVCPHHHFAYKFKVTLLIGIE